MKRAFMPVMFAATILAAGCQPSKEQVAKKFKDKCIANISNQEQAEKPDHIKLMMEDACGCMGEKLAEKYSAKEVDEIAGIMNSMDEKDMEKRNELAMKIGPVLQPCILEMQQKMIEAMATDSLTPGAIDSAAPGSPDSLNR